MEIYYYSSYLNSDLEIANLLIQKSQHQTLVAYLEEYLTRLVNSGRFISLPNPAYSNFALRRQLKREKQNQPEKKAKLTLSIKSSVLSDDELKQFFNSSFSDYQFWTIDNLLNYLVMSILTSTDSEIVSPISQTRQDEIYNLFSNLKYKHLLNQ